MSCFRSCIQGFFGGHVARFMVSGLMAWTMVTSAHGALYTVLTLDSLGGGPSTPTGINSAGQVVGYGLTAGGQTHAFLYSSGALSDLGTLGGDYSFAFGLNDLGQVVGESRNASGVTHAFLHSGGSLGDLGTLGGSSLNSAATAINNVGEIVGYSQTFSGGPNEAFVYAGGSMTPLGTLGGGGYSNAYGINESTQIIGHSNGNAFLYSGGILSGLGSATTAATGINETGQIVGYTSSGATHAFLHSGGTLTDLGTLSGVRSVAHALNDYGQVVGFFELSGGESRAFLYSGGVMQDLNSLIDPGFEIQAAYGINFSGQIAAFGIETATGQAHGLLLSPVPEPASFAAWSVFGAAIFGMARFKGRRRIASSNRSFDG